MTGSWADYTKTSAAQVITLTRTTAKGPEVITVTANASDDVIVFSDGALAASAIKSALDASITPTLDVSRTSGVPVIPHAGSVEVKAIAQDGSMIATGFGAGVHLVAVGSRGVDVVYIKEGSDVDATRLGFGQDQIYLRGRWADYTKEVTDNQSLTFARTVGGIEEKVVVSAASGTGNDQIIFFDGATLSHNALLACLDNAHVALNQISGYTTSLKTPGVDIDPPVIAIDPIWGDNIFSLSEKIESGNSSGRTITGTFGSGSGAVEDGQKVTLTIDDHVYIGTASNNAWSVFVPDTVWSSLAHGNEYAVTARAKDLAGNESNVASGQFVVSLATPDVPTVNVVKTTDLAPRLSGLAKKVVSQSAVGSHNQSDYIALSDGDGLHIQIFKKMRMEVMPSFPGVNTPMCWGVMQIRLG